MKAVALPVFEGHSTVVVCPHNRKDKLVKLILILHFEIERNNWQDTSFVTLFSNCDRIPHASGECMYVEFKAGYEYILLPSNRTDQGTLMAYPEKPEFVKQFPFRIELAQVDQILTPYIFK